MPLDPGPALARIPATRAWLDVRLAGERPFRLSDVGRVLTALGQEPGAALDGEPDITGAPFAEVVYFRLVALIGLSGRTVDATSVELFGDSRPLARSHLLAGTSPLNLTHVDAVLALLGAPVGALFGPVLGPLDLELLRQVRDTPALAAGMAAMTKAERAAVQLVTTIPDAITFLARRRGEYVPSRPKGSSTNGAGGMLNRAGCQVAVRRLVDQRLLLPGPPLSLSPAGLALAGAVTTINPEN